MDELDIPTSLHLGDALLIGSAHTIDVTGCDQLLGLIEVQLKHPSQSN